MNIKQQQGAALFVSLMFLFLMTIIGLNALNTSTSDERMALNTQHQQQVFHAAESSINVVKRDITSLEEAISTGAASTPVSYTGQADVAASYARAVTVAALFGPSRQSGLSAEILTMLVDS